MDVAMAGIDNVNNAFDLIGVFIQELFCPVKKFKRNRVQKQKYVLQSKHYLRTFLDYFC